MTKRNPKRPTPHRPEPAAFDTVRVLALSLPGVEEGTSYRTPAFFVAGKLFARLHQDGESLVLMIDPAERAMRMKTDPECYYITDHYLNYPMMLVRLAVVDRDDLGELLEGSWRRSAPERLVAERDGRSR